MPMEPHKVALMKWWLTWLVLTGADQLPLMPPLSPSFHLFLSFFLLFFFSSSAFFHPLFSSHPSSCVLFSPIRFPPHSPATSLHFFFPPAPQPFVLMWWVHLLWIVLKGTCHHSQQPQFFYIALFTAVLPVREQPRGSQCIGRFRSLTLQKASWMFVSCIIRLLPSYWTVLLSNRNTLQRESDDKKTVIILIKIKCYGKV